MPRTMVSSYGPDLSAPRWAGDFGSRDYVLPGGVKLRPEQFSPGDAIFVDVAVAGAAINATSVPIVALTSPDGRPTGSVAIPRYTTLFFSSTKQVTLTDDAKVGDTTLTVEPIPVALVDTDTVFYGGRGQKRVVSGTVVGRTIAERDAGQGYGPAADTDDTGEIFLLMWDVDDVDRIDEGELYRPGGVVYENFVPNFAGLSATIKAALRSRYQCTVLLESP